METPIISVYPGGTPNTGATQYTWLKAGTWVNALESGDVVSFAGIISNWQINLAAAPGSGKSWKFTLYKNGVATAQTITIANTSKTGSNTIAEVDVSAGDQLMIESIPTGTPTDLSQFRSSMLFTADEVSILVGGSGNTNLNGAPRYYPLCGSTYGGTTTEALASAPMPCAGRLSDLYVAVKTAPGGVATWGITLMKNGVAQTLAATVLSDATTGADVSHYVDVEAGDVISIKCTKSGTPTASKGQWGLKFRPIADGDAVLLFASEGATTTTAARYNLLCGGGDIALSDTIGYRSQILNEASFKNLYIKTSGAPGAGKNYSFAITKDGAAQVLSCTIADAATTGSDTEHTFSTTASNLLSVVVTPTGTPAEVSCAWGVVANMADVEVGAKAPNPQLPPNYLLRR